jgi:hypothetical protein
MAALLVACRPAPADTPATFLDPATLHVIHLKLTRPAWDAMQPTRRGVFAGVFAASQPANAETKHESPFGYQYIYVRADVECDGAAYPGVGLRYKGNSSYMLARDVKKPLKIDLDHFDKKLEHAGLSGFNLHNDALDPTMIRESLSYAVFREAGVPAPRTSRALVYLSVEKMHERKLAGLYTIIEEVDKAFLKDRFGSSKGLLLKPENCFNMPYLGEDFARYRTKYRPKTDETPQTTRRLIDFVKLVHQSDDATFERSIGDYLDTDGFLRFLAGNVLLSNMDSFLSTGHNYYMYVHPRTLKIHFIPWDLNLSLGTFDWVGPVRQQVDLDLFQPTVMANRLTERVLAIPKYERAYIDIIERMTRTSFSPEFVGKQVALLRDGISRAEKQANVPHRPLPKALAPESDPLVFVATRLESVRGQLAGTHQGYLPYWQQGFFGVGKPPARRPRATTIPSTRPTSPAPAPAGK